MGSMEGWLYLIESNRLMMTNPRKRYFVICGNRACFWKDKPANREEAPIKSGTIDPYTRVTDHGREIIHARTLFVFTIYDSYNHEDKLKFGAKSSEEAAKWMEAFKEAAEQAHLPGKDRPFVPAGGLQRRRYPFSAVEHIAGGNPGYRDGSTKEALFNEPKKLTVDSDGTIYVADTKNFAVRMITRAGLVTTIAGGSNRTGHNDGEGNEVTFSNDFDVTYVSSTCSLVVADRGTRLIREIQLPQFIGRCGGATPNSPGSTFTSAALLMSLLAGIFGTVAGAILTILTISAQRLEQLKSKLCWAGNHRRSQVTDLEEESEVLINPASEGDIDDSRLRHKKRNC